MKDVELRRHVVDVSNPFAPQTSGLSSGARMVRSAILKLFQRVTPRKECRRLGGNEACVGNDAAEFAFVGAVFHAGAKNYGFFAEDA